MVNGVKRSMFTASFASCAVLFAAASSLAWVSVGSFDQAFARFGGSKTQFSTTRELTPIHLEGSEPLRMPVGVPNLPDLLQPKGDLFIQQIEQEDNYFMRLVLATPAARDRLWRPDFVSQAAYRRSLAGHLANLKRLLGLRETAALRADLRVLEDNSNLIIEDVALPLEPDDNVRALVFLPRRRAPGPALIVVPPANETREHFLEIQEGMNPTWLTALLSRNVAVAVPLIVERKSDHPICQQLGGIDRRNLLNRLAFIVGHSLVGLEAQQVIALHGYLARQPMIDAKRIGVFGKGQGGMTALYAAALDRGLAGATVLDYFEPSEEVWKEPSDRALWGQLNEFGDAEIAALIAPRPLIVTFTAEGPTPVEKVRQETRRALRFYEGLHATANLNATLVAAPEEVATSTEKAANALGAARDVKGDSLRFALRISTARIEAARNEQFESLHRHLRRLDEASDQSRENYWKLRSTPASDRASVAARLRRELTAFLGVIPPENVPLRPRTALIQVTDSYAAYNVLLDVLTGVEAYGQLLIPRKLTGRAPVVICQHGLGGRPADVTGVGENPDKIYHAFAAHLAEHGYVVFAPYTVVPVPSDVLLTPIVRKAEAVGKMKASIELAKLRRIVDYLESLPFVDGERIGYYGLSYGGYHATWLSPLEPRIRAVVISGHFNHQRTKLTDETNPTSFLHYPADDADYPWNLLNRFTHLELIAADYPRPVCVEFAERDGTTTPEWHARAWREVEAFRRAWNVEDKFVRSDFNGVHEVHGGRSFFFLDRWLRPDESASADYIYHLWPPGRLLPGVPENPDEKVPFVTHNLDADGGSRIQGRFYVSHRSRVFFGLAVKVSRVGRPGNLLLRFGTREGAGDVGVAELPSAQIPPRLDLWQQALIKPVRLDPEKLYYFELSAEWGEAPENYYVVYGPRPLGGTDHGPHFGLSYRVITADPKPQAAPEETYGFLRALLTPYHAEPLVPGADAAPEQDGEIRLTARWSIDVPAGSDPVVRTAAADLSDFLQNGLRVPSAASESGLYTIRLRIASSVEGVSTEEGYRVEAEPNALTIAGIAPRGVLRGVYWLEDQLRLRRAPFVKRGVTVRNCRFPFRISTAFRPGGGSLSETSEPMLYSDGLLARLSHDGYNAIWVDVNTEEITLHSKIFPELDDPEAEIRLARLDDLSRRAKRFGIDVFPYLSTGYNHHLPKEFFDRHPEVLGYGWGPPMCTSVATVRKFYAEVVETLFEHASELRGVGVIYDSEGFWYCGNSERTRLECPRCRNRTQESIAAELLKTLDDAMHEAGGPDTRLIAWNYNVNSSWVTKLVPLLPADIIVQGDFDKGMVEVKDGIQHVVEDYSLSNLGPPDNFVNEYHAARDRGMTVMTKTESFVSQEAVFIPYIPAMEQWYARNAKIREYNLGGIWATWSHYGWTPSRPAELTAEMAFDPLPTMQEMLMEIARRGFGDAAAPYVMRAWHDFSEGIREYPYSDPVARTPGPIQRGPSHPFFLDPNVKGFGPWRSWQNDLQWTAPWGTAVTEKYLRQVRDWYSRGVAELEEGRTAAPPSYRSEVDSELGVARTFQSALETGLNLIEWLNARNDFFEARSAAEREVAAERLERVAWAERENAVSVLPILEADSRLGCAGQVGDARGGLFTPALVRWKIGEMDDLILLRLPQATGRPPGPALARKLLAFLAE